MRTTLSQFALLTVLLAAFAGCSDDTPIEPLPDVGSGDVGSDVGKVCELDEAPVGGDFCDCEGDQYTGRVDLCDRECECEFGFWTCEETCDEPPALELEISSALSVDEQSGNGDGQINPGETWVVSGTISAKNAPEGGADVSLRLSSSSIFVEVDGTGQVLEALDDTEVTFTLPFVVSSSAPAGEATVTVEAFSGFTSGSQDVDFAIVQPAVAELVFENTAIFKEDSPAVRINPEDELEVSTTLRNTGTLAAEDVRVSLSPSANSLEEPPDEQTVGIVAPGESVDVTFPVQVAKSPTVFDLRLTLGATSTTAETITDVIDLSIRRPAVLKADDEAYVWDTSGMPEVELVITVENTSNAAVSGLTWEHYNFESSPEECEIPEAPCFELVDFRAPIGPSTIGPLESVEVRLPLTVDAATPAEGLVTLRVTSSDTPTQQFAFPLNDVPQL